MITGGDDSAKRSFGIPEYSAWNTFWAMNVIHIYLFVCINCEQVIFMYLSRNTKTRRLSLHGLTTDISVTGKWRRSCGQKISAGGCRLTMNSFLCGAGLGCWAAGLVTPSQGHMAGPASCSAHHQATIRASNKGSWNIHKHRKDMLPSPGWKCLLHTGAFTLKTLLKTQCLMGIDQW